MSTESPPGPPRKADTQADVEPKINPTLKKMVQKVLSSNTEDEELLASLNSLSTFYNKNTLEARWTLRDRLEMRVLNASKQFLEAFDGIQVELTAILRDVENMKKSCDDMHQRLQETKQASGLLIQQADKLFKTEAQTEAQLSIATAFLDRFQLTPAEEKAIKSADVNKEFFEALRHAHKIQDDCNMLLHSKNQRAGLEIREQMTELMEVGYRKLYRWVRSECKVLEREAPEVSPLLITAFEALQERPVLLNYCLEEVGSTRNKVLVKAFIDALTVGGPNGIPRPIEINAHDPLRYVGDMAAWIHQTLATEQELVTTLLKNFRRETEEEKRFYEESIAKSLSLMLSGVCRPFKVRVDQIILSHTSANEAFQLANLLQFYEVRFRELLKDSTAPIVQTFEEARKLAMSAFERAGAFAADKEAASQQRSEHGIS